MRQDCDLGLHVVLMSGKIIQVTNKNLLFAVEDGEKRGKDGGKRRGRGGEGVGSARAPVVISMMVRVGVGGGGTGVGVWTGGGGDQYDGERGGGGWWWKVGVCGGWGGD